MKQTKFPKGWDEAKVRRVLRRYEQQTEEEATAEDEAAFEKQTHTVIKVPSKLLPTIRGLIAKQRAADKAA